MLSWLFAGSQLFFSCTGDIDNTYNYENGPTQHPAPEKLTASLMIKQSDPQAVVFKPSGDRVSWTFDKDPTVYMNDRTRKCADVGYQYHECLDVHSDDTTFYFGVDTHDYVGKTRDTAHLEGTLDRVTGQLALNIQTSHSNDGKDSWSHVTYTMACKKVDKLLDAK
jgi:hypothetical protein